MLHVLLSQVEPSRSCLIILSVLQETTLLVPFTSVVLCRLYVIVHCIRFYKQICDNDDYDE